MISIDSADHTKYIVSSHLPKREGLVIHGYGSNKEEILGLAVNLAKSTESRIVVFDLPGHGGHHNVELNLENATKSLSSVINNRNKPSFVVGHSLGARLAFMANISIVAAISMPLDSNFEGDRKDLLKTLRARRVTERSAYSGLGEILSKEVMPADRTLLLRADLELKSVNSLCKSWKKLGIDCQKIKGTNHLDIVSSPQTIDIIANWLTEQLNESS